MLGLGTFAALAFHLPQTLALANASSKRYLSPTGTDSNNNCTNAGSPCATWQHTLDAAQAGGAILVAGGVYTDIIVSDNITQAAVISQSVTIQGAYTAVFTEPPDPTANPTILNAQGQGRVLTIRDAGQVTINGLQLTGGKTSGANDRGGGLYAINTNLVLANSVIYKNQAGYGGGIYVQTSQMMIQNNDISENDAQFGGGGIRCYDCTGTIQQNDILSNTAVLHGGGFYISNSPLTLAHNIVQNNEVSTSSNGWGGGGQLYNSEAVLVRNLISGNRGYRGGGLRLLNSPTELQGNVIRNNEANTGGGLSLETTSYAYLENNAILENSATSQGAGIYIRETDSELRHTTFNNNGQTAVYVERSAQVNLVNSLMANQTNGIINDGGSVTLTTTLLDNVTTFTQGTVSQSNVMTGTAGFAANGYHITAVSDARNNAIPTDTIIDIDNQARPHLNGPDIGADEWWSLDARKTVSHDTVEPGLTVTYTIMLTNTTDTTTSILLTDTLPAQVDYVGPVTTSSGSVNYNGSAVLWQGSLTPDQSVAIIWPVQVAASVQPGTTITNSATIQDEQGIYETTTAVMVVPSEVYLPLIVK